MTPVLPTGQLTLVVIVLAGLTAIGGILPARKASRTSPVEVLTVDG